MMNDLEQARLMLLEDPAMIPDAMKALSTPMGQELGIAAYQILFVWNNTRGRHPNPDYVPFRKQVHTAAMRWVRKMVDDNMYSMDAFHAYVRSFGTSLPEELSQILGKTLDVLRNNLYIDPTLRGAAYSFSLAQVDAEWGRHAMHALVRNLPFSDIPPSYVQKLTPADVRSATPSDGRPRTQGSAVSQIMSTKPRTEPNPYEKAFSTIHGGSDLRRNIYLYLSAYEDGMIETSSFPYSSAYDSVLKHVKEATKRDTRLLKDAPKSYPPVSLFPKAAATSFARSRAKNGWVATIRRVFADPVFLDFMESMTLGSSTVDPVALDNLPSIHDLVPARKTQVPSAIRNTVDDGVMTMVSAILAESEDVTVVFDYPRVEIRGKRIPVQSLFRPGIKAEISVQGGMQRLTLIQG